MLSTIYHELIPIDFNVSPILIFKQSLNKDSVGTPLHWHEQIEFYYVVDGSLNLNCSGHIFTLKKGDIGFVNWCEPHKGFNFEDGTIFHTIQVDLASFDISLLHQYNQFTASGNHILNNKILPTKELAALFECLIKEYAYSKTAREYMLKSYIYGIFALIERTHSADRQTKKRTNRSFLNVLDVIKYISNNYHLPLSLDYLSKEFAISKSYMSQIFSKYTGNSVHRFINQIRCQYAAILIIENTPLNEVYSMVGFNDYNYFSRKFKQIIGVSPSRYSSKTSQTAIPLVTD